MDILFHGNDGDTRFDIPDEQIAWVASPANIPACANLETELLNGLQNPIGMESLADLVKARGKNTVIIVDDIARVTPHKELLPPLLDALNEIGVSDENITLLIALGTHREMTRDECIRHYGEAVVRRVKLVNHDWQDTDQLVDLGTTSTGIPVLANKLLLENDISIAVGNIVPHIYAGWSGGGKMILPGVCGAKSTAYTHIAAAKMLNKILGNPDNPVRLDIEEIASRCKLSMIVNAVINSDGSVAGIVVGDPVKAHRAGVAIGEKIYCSNVEPAVDAVIVNAYPCDSDFWQSTKAMTAGSLFVKPGGKVVLVTSAPEGIPSTHPELLALGDKSNAEVVEMLEKGLITDEVAASVHMTMSFCREKAEVTIATSEKNAGIVERLGFRYVNIADIAKWISELVSANPNFRIGVATHGADLAPLR